MRGEAGKQRVRTPQTVVPDFLEVRNFISKHCSLLLVGSDLHLVSSLRIPVQVSGKRIQCGGNIVFQSAIPARPSICTRYGT